MTPDWTRLDTELDRWRAGGLTLPLWWRDDDAVAPGPALARLGDLARSLDLPVHLAVIPKGATQALADHLLVTPRLIPVVHGWAHVSHAPADSKKAEFGDHRPLATMAAEAAQGLARLSDLFEGRLQRMFVPPWNRIAPQMAGELAGIGYLALSAFTPRKAPFAAPRLARINTHLDPIAWKAGRGLIDPDLLIGQVAQQLRDRRTGHADNQEPYGILTHHLVHDKATWDFTGALLSRLLAGPTHRWRLGAPTRKDTTT